VAGGLCAAFCEILNLQSLILLQRGESRSLPGLIHWRLPIGDFRLTIASCSGGL
jgi:hypothetical protein